MLLDNVPIERLTLRRVLLLRELADGFSEREAAERLGMPYPTVRSMAAELQEITGIGSGRELGRWWRRARGEWLAAMSAAAGGLA